MKWEDISKRLPGRSAISCRLHYQNFLERRPEWDEEKKTKLARLYERFKQGMWDPIAKELHMPWRAAEAMHWQLVSEGMARRAGVPVFSTAQQSQPQTMSQHYQTNLPPSYMGQPVPQSTSYASSPGSQHQRPLQPLLQRQPSPPTSYPTNQSSSQPYQYPHDQSFTQQSQPQPYYLSQPPGQQPSRQEPQAPPHVGPRRSISTNNMYTASSSQISPRRRAFSATRASGTLPHPDASLSGSQSAHPALENHQSHSHEHPPRRFSENRLLPPHHHASYQSSPLPHENGSGGHDIDTVPYDTTTQDVETEQRRASAGDELQIQRQRQRSWPPPPINPNMQEQPRTFPPMRTVEEAVEDDSSAVEQVQRPRPLPEPQQHRPSPSRSSRAKSNGNGNGHIITIPAEEADAEHRLDHKAQSP